MAETSARKQDPQCRFSVVEIQQWLTAWLAHRLRRPAADFSHETRFQAFGIDSMAGVELAAELQNWLGIDVPSTLVWDYPTVGEVARYLGQD